jgi:hypothetical protein
MVARLMRIRSHPVTDGVVDRTKLNAPRSARGCNRATPQRAHLDSQLMGLRYTSWITFLFLPLLINSITTAVPYAATDLAVLNQATIVSNGTTVVPIPEGNVYQPQVSDYYFQYATSTIDSIIQVSFLFLDIPSASLSFHRTELSLYYQNDQNVTMVHNCSFPAEDVSSSCRGWHTYAGVILDESSRSSPGIWIRVFRNATDFGQTRKSNLWLAISELSPSIPAIPMYNGAISSDSWDYETYLSLSYFPNLISFRFLQPSVTWRNVSSYRTSNSSNNDIGTIVSWQLYRYVHESTFQTSIDYTSPDPHLMTLSSCLQETAWKSSSDNTTAFRDKLVFQPWNNAVYIYNVVLTVQDPVTSQTASMAFVAMPIVVPSYATIYYSSWLLYTTIITATIILAVLFVCVFFLLCACSCCGLRKEPTLPSSEPAEMDSIEDHISSYADDKQSSELSFCSCVFVFQLEHWAQLASVSNLRVLNLDRCHLTEIPSDLFVSLFLIRTLRFSRNEIKVLPDTIGNLKQLATLDVSHNRLSQLPLTLIDNCEALTHCNVAFNSLTICPNVSRWTKLHYLNLSHNWIRYLHPSLSKRRNLVVQARYNPLLSIPPLMMTPSDLVVSFHGLLFPRTLVLPFWILGLRLKFLPPALLLDGCYLLVAIIILWLVTQIRYASASVDLYRWLIAVPLSISMFLLLAGACIATILAFHNLKLHRDSSNSLMIAVLKKGRKSSCRTMIFYCWRGFFRVLSSSVQSLQLAALVFAPPSRRQYDDSLAWVYESIWFQLGPEIPGVQLYLTTAAIFFVTVFRVLFESTSLFGVAVEKQHAEGQNDAASCSNRCESLVLHKIGMMPAIINETWEKIFAVAEGLSELLFLPLLLRLWSTPLCQETPDGLMTVVDSFTACHSQKHGAIVGMSLLSLALYATPGILCIPIWQEKERDDLVRFKPIYLVATAVVQFILTFLASIFGESTPGFALSYLLCTFILWMLTLLLRPTSMAETDLILTVLGFVPFWTAVLGVLAIWWDVPVSVFAGWFVMGILGMIIVAAVIFVITMIIVIARYYYLQNEDNIKGREKDVARHLDHLQQERRSREIKKSFHRAATVVQVVAAFKNPGSPSPGDSLIVARNVAFDEHEVEDELTDIEILTESEEDSLID